MSLIDEGIYVRMLVLPEHVKGCTVPNGDGSFDVYINDTLSDGEKRRALDHELRHIRGDHFYMPESVAATETAANKEPQGRLTATGNS